MKKISTLFEKDPQDLSRVIDVINPENKWVIHGQGIPTRKFDGACCAIMGGEIYKRYDCKIDIKTGEYKRCIPEGAIPCQEPDFITGHHPHWVKCNKNNPADKYFLEGFERLMRETIITYNFDPYKPNILDGTYELCGEKINGNPEMIEGHKLIKHGLEILNILDFSYRGLREYLSNPKIDIEGIVFYHEDKEDGRMCKIRKSDFGIRR